MCMPLLQGWVSEDKQERWMRLLKCMYDVCSRVCACACVRTCCLLSSMCGSAQTDRLMAARNIHLVAAGLRVCAQEHLKQEHTVRNVEIYTQIQFSRQRRLCLKWPFSSSWSNKTHSTSSQRNIMLRTCGLLCDTAMWWTGREQEEAEVEEEEERLRTRGGRGRW